MIENYRTLRVNKTDKGVLSVVIDAPPMNMIGPELVRDLVSRLQRGPELHGHPVRAGPADPRPARTQPRRPSRIPVIWRPTALDNQEACGSWLTLISGKLPTCGSMPRWPRCWSESLRAARRRRTRARVRTSSCPIGSESSAFCASWRSLRASPRRPGPGTARSQLPTSGRPRLEHPGRTSPARQPGITARGQ
jgi:hypothetical protein